MIDHTQFDDEMILRLMAQSNVDALEELYNRYSRLVYGLALHILGDSGSAEEVTQDCFLRAWNHASSYRQEQGKVSTWLVSIARNRSIDMIRKSSARHEDSISSIEEIPNFHLSANQNVEIEVELLQEQVRVRKALAELPLEQREALALAYFGGLTQDQIAQKLGQPLGTVKTRIRLAMQKLRGLLLEDVPDRERR